MGKQQIRQRARQQALGAAVRQRQAQQGRDRRVRSLVEQVLTAIGEREAAVADTERRAGAALAQMTRVEGLTLAQAVEWCGDELSAREATRLRRLATETATEAAAPAEARTGQGNGADAGDGDDGEPRGPSALVGADGRVAIAAGQGGPARSGTSAG